VYYNQTDKRMKIFTALILFTLPIYSQKYTSRQLDSLYNVFVEINRSAGSEDVNTGFENNKCAFGIVSRMVRNIESYQDDKKQLLKSLLQRPTKQKSIVSPSGNFRIHYDLTGNQVPNYDPLLSADENAMQVALVADSSYNFEVHFLGYPPPPGDSILNVPDSLYGGDNLYDIYITTALGSYGFTQPESPLGNQKYTSYIEMHYSFKNFYTEGLDAARVTVAHELHHAIQVGNYSGDKFDIDPFFYEMTSTSMEEFVYDDVNDYYAYMRNYFINPNRIFNSFRSSTVDGYDMAIWNIFLQNKFGYGIIKKQWEMLPGSSALAAIQSSLYDEGSSLTQALNEFGIWTFFTKYRAVPGKYFEEAANYPPGNNSPIKLITTSYIPNSPVSLDKIKATSNNFLAFVNTSATPPDTLVAIITNSDYVSAIDSASKDFLFEYTLASDSSEGSVMLANNYFAKFDVDEPNFWSVSEVLNNEVVRQNGTIIPPTAKGNELFAYPNPFYYNKIYNNGCNCIKIIADSKGEPEADFNVYTPAMELVYAAKIPFDITGKILNWEIRKIPDKKLASGVYIYVVKVGDETNAGKLVIFNE
jgi:hypothetical protein